MAPGTQVKEKVEAKSFFLLKEEAKSLFQFLTIWNISNISPAAQVRECNRRAGRCQSGAQNTKQACQQNLTKYPQYPCCSGYETPNICNISWISANICSLIICKHQVFLVLCKYPKLFSAIIIILQLQMHLVKVANYCWMQTSQVLKLSGLGEHD